MSSGKEVKALEEESRKSNTTTSPSNAGGRDESSQETSKDKTIRIDKTKAIVLLTFTSQYKIIV